MGQWPSRDQAQAILDQWMSNENLKKHAYAVEAAMRAYAAKLGADPDSWGIVGVLHDMDYEKHPHADKHPWVGAQYLREQGYPAELVDAVMAHAEHTGAPRDTVLKKAIFAVDELTGLIVAVALVRPSKKLADVSVDSVLRKWKDKRFAAGVNRQLIEQGARELGVPLEQHVETVLHAMQGIAEKLGL
jgi:putative nucleotidyltransferase with HDIG domain